MKEKLKDVLVSVISTTILLFMLPIDILKFAKDRLTK